MFDMTWKIQLGGYLLKLLESVEIVESVDLLSDTAIIKLPATALNKALEIESKIKRGDVVDIQLGYDNSLKSEFKGFIERISTDDSAITIICEDGIFLTRVPVKDKEMKNVTSKDVAQYVVDQVNLSLPADKKISLSCDYELKYDKFVINKANGRDVLNRLQEDTKGNIYMKDRTLHFHPAYVQKFGDVKYDFSVNIEKSDLQYRRADDRRYEVEVEGVGSDGKRTVVTLGTTGGEKRTIKVSGVTDSESLKKRGQEELNYLVFDGYEGSITGWMVPEVHPGYSAKITDQDYEYKSGSYYVVTVTTTFDSNGGVKKVQIGRKLS
jgi:hypothetical protein